MTEELTNALNGLLNQEFGYSNYSLEEITKQKLDHSNSINSCEDIREYIYDIVNSKLKKINSKYSKEDDVALAYFNTLIGPSIHPSSEYNDSNFSKYANLMDFNTEDLIASYDRTNNNIYFYFPFELENNNERGNIKPFSIILRKKGSKADNIEQLPILSTLKDMYTPILTDLMRCEEIINLEIKNKKQ